MSQRTFLEDFSVTSASVLVEVVNKYAARLQLEILNVSVIHNPNSKYPIKAVVLFEKKIVLNSQNNSDVPRYSPPPPLEYRG